ncbi:hypothetical protein BSR28_00955 [Boudabousia liubingyangii]|uniref:hypothetical protein n=1 Tax=Boudabousia liubingyangii TaxID=1921764 RepID=UPI00093AD38C|nr:hypothetical protein [Boudabousia liubingyangii]OKL48305.1 hypothetical protein BSR28_00955 [Boudabousia liubingyangii]
MDYTLADFLVGMPAWQWLVGSDEQLAQFEAELADPGLDKESRKALQQQVDALRPFASRWEGITNPFKEPYLAGQVAITLAATDDEGVPAGAFKSVTLDGWATFEALPPADDVLVSGLPDLPSFQVDFAPEVRERWQAELGLSGPFTTRCFTPWDPEVKGRQQLLFVVFDGDGQPCWHLSTPLNALYPPVDFEGQSGTQPDTESQLEAQGPEVIRAHEPQVWLQNPLASYTGSSLFVDASGVQVEAPGALSTEPWLGQVDWPAARPGSDAAGAALQLKHPLTCGVPERFTLIFATALLATLRLFEAEGGSLSKLAKAFETRPPKAYVKAQKLPEDKQWKWAQKLPFHKEFKAALKARRAATPLALDALGPVVEGDPQRVTELRFARTSRLSETVLSSDLGDFMVVSSRFSASARFDCDPLLISRERFGAESELPSPAPGFGPLAGSRPHLYGGVPTEAEADTYGQQHSAWCLGFGEQGASEFWSFEPELQQLRYFDKHHLSACDFQVTDRGIQMVVSGPGGVRTVRAEYFSEGDYGVLRFDSALFATQLLPVLAGIAWWEAALL